MMGYVPVPTPLEQLGHAKQAERRGEALKTQADAKQAETAQYVQLHPHLTQWPQRHVEFFVMVLLTLLPLFPDPLLERPLVEELLRIANLDGADVAVWTWRFVVFQMLLIGGLSWLGAAREDGGRLRVLGFVVALGMPLISLAIATQAAQTDTLTVVIDGGVAPPPLWEMAAGKLGIWGLSLFSMAAHLLLWFAAPSVVGGSVEIAQAVKWLRMRRGARLAAKQVQANAAQVDRLVDGAQRTAMKTRDRAGATGLTRNDVVGDPELSSLLEKRHDGEQFKTLYDPAPNDPKSGERGELSEPTTPGLKGNAHTGHINGDDRAGASS
jgi:hypothetical protein